MNLDKSAAMMRTSLEWRRDNNIDEILTTDIPKCIADSDIIQTYIAKLPLLLRTDKAGHKVLFSRFGRIDHRGLCDCFTEDEICRAMAWGLENIKAQLFERYEDSGCTVIPQLCVVLDMQGCGTHTVSSFSTIIPFIHT